MDRPEHTPLYVFSFSDYYRYTIDATIDIAHLYLTPISHHVRTAISFLGRTPGVSTWHQVPGTSHLRRENMPRYNSSLGLLSPD